MADDPVVMMMRLGAKLEKERIASAQDFIEKKIISVFDALGIKDFEIEWTTIEKKREESHD